MTTEGNLVQAIGLNSILTCQYHCLDLLTSMHGERSTLLRSMLE